MIPQNEGQVTAYQYELPRTSWFYRSCVSPVCDQLVVFVPESVRPDHITVAGLVSAVIAAVILPYTPLISLLLWISYATCDNLDGKHARRTKQSSVRGEFLDHVADSATCQLLVYVLSYGFMNLTNRAHLLISLATQIPFLLGCWYYHNTGKVLLGGLRTPDSELGPLVTVDEINYIAVPLLVLGHSVVVSHDVLPFGLSFGCLAMYASVAGCVFESAGVLTEIFEARPPTDAGQIKILASCTVYVAAVALCDLSPAVTLPVYVWLCSCLIYGNCAAKLPQKIHSSELQTNIVLPGVGALLLAISSVIFREHFAVVRVMLSLLASGAVYSDLRALRG